MIPKEVLEYYRIGRPNQGQEIRVLHPIIVAKLKLLNARERMRFIESFQVSETLPREMKEKQLAKLWSELCIRCECIRSEHSPSQETTDHQRTTDKRSNKEL
jgi:hypothetical protein